MSRASLPWPQLALWVASLALTGCRTGASAAPSTEPGADPLGDARLSDDASPAQRARMSEGERAYASGDDAAARAAFESLLEELEAQGQRAGAKDGVRLRLALSMARAGDGAGALSQLEALDAPEAVPLVVAAVRARALDDAGGSAALVAWHELWAVAAQASDVATASYARVQSTAGWLEASEAVRREAAAAAGVPAAKVCFELRMREPRATVEVPWQKACRPPRPVVGVLLPRSGRFAALADRHLAALSVGTRLLSPDMADLEMHFADAGSTPQSAVDAAGRLVAAGATVLIGPVSEPAVRAVGEAWGERVRVITPGPGAAPAVPMASSLEARVDALLDLGAAEGCAERGFVVFRAEGGYGQRARDRLRESTLEISSKYPKGIKVYSDLTYPSNATSFAPMVDRGRAALDRGACVLLFDTLGRSELVLRQLRRSGYGIGDDGSWVGSLAEGLDAGAVDGRAALAGLVVAPVALPDPSSSFQDAYRLRTGRAADDQALMVWRAMRLALWNLPPPAGVELGRFDAGGQLQALLPEEAG